MQPINNTPPYSPQHTYQYLCNWYRSDVGKRALVQLQQCIEVMSADIFGYFALEIGVLAGEAHFLAASRIRHRFCSGLSQEHKGCSDGLLDLVADPSALPIQRANLDLIVATHVLDYSAVPHVVLREIERSLVPEGHCILIGFNPISWRGLGHKLAGWRNKTGFQLLPFYHQWRIRDWFTVLGFEVLDVQVLSYQPNISMRFWQYTRWLDHAGSRLQLPIGNIYVMHARKRVANVMVLKSKYRSSILTPASDVIVGSGSSGRNTTSHHQS